MEMTPVSELEVVNVLHSLKPKDSVGYDGISIKILKHCACVIKKPLTHTLCQSRTSSDQTALLRCQGFVSLMVQIIP
jgi:hypothetical protein